MVDSVGGWWVAWMGGWLVAWLGAQLLIIKLTSAQLSFPAAGTWLTLATDQANGKGSSIARANFFSFTIISFSLLFEIILNDIVI